MSNGRALWFRDRRPDEGKAFEQLSPSDQVDVACDAYEKQWQQGEPPSIEHFLEDLPLHTKQRAFQEMLPLECEYRIQQGEKISFRDLADRFPEYTLVIARTLCGDDQIIAHTRPAIDRLGDLHLLEVAGRGTFGTAYRAYDERLDRFVAAKLPHPAILNNDESVRRFVREGRNAGRLSHPGIVSVYDVRKSERGPFIVSDYVEGGTLSDYIKAQKLISPRTAASLVAQLAEALDYAHQHGIVHRDLKPGNVMLEPRKPGDSTQDGTPHDSLRPRILDFGLAHRQDGEASLTMEGTMVGTPAYMSPEQARGEISKTDARVDIYSLGVVLYEIMVGQRLFDGESYSAVLTQVLHEDATAPRRFDRGIPQDLATICSKCLDPSPERRYQNAADLAADLRRWLNNEPIHARPISRTERSVRWVNRHRSIALSLCAVIVVITIAGFLLLRQARHSLAQKSIDGMFEVQPANLALAIHEVRNEVPPSILTLRSEDSTTTAQERLLLRLCMAPKEKLPPDVVIDGINRLDVSELAVVGEELAAAGFADTARLWQTLREADPTMDPASWLRTAGCLACVESQVEKWRGMSDRLACALTSVPPEQSSDWARMFRSLGTVLSEPLKKAYETTADASVRTSACLALAAVLEQQPHGLVELLENAEGPGHQAITAALRQHETAPRLLRKRLRERLTLSGTELAAEALVQKQANLSLGLLALGHADIVWPLFAGSRDDPRLQTYLIRLVPDCSSIEPLVHRLYSEKDADVRYAVTLAIGRYADSLLHNLDKEKLIRHLQSVYLTHPDSGVHSSTGWLLRRLGQSLDELNASLLAEGIVPDRDWFHNSLGECMIIVREQEFLMGSPADEPGHVDSEMRHVHRNGRPYTIAAREMTWGVFRTLMEEFERGGGDEYPVESIRFAEFVEFCRRLNEQESLDDVFVKGESEGTWRADLTREGYRMPIDGEWECAARAGTVLMRFFGDSDSSHLDMYMSVSSDAPYPVGSYMPNRWGLFDLYGNVCDLTLTKFDRERKRDAYQADTPYSELSSYDVLVQRGGRFGAVSLDHRSACRGPTTLLSMPLRATGYRLTRSISL